MAFAIASGLTLQAGVWTSIIAGFDGPGHRECAFEALHLVALDATRLDALRQLHRAVKARGGQHVIRNLQEQPKNLPERSGFARRQGDAAT